MQPEHEEIVKEVLRDILSHMDINLAEIQTQVSEETVVFNLRTADSGILIGGRGANLVALQHMARLLVHKRLSEPLNFVVDVEGYKQSREEFLRELARQAADRVRETKEGVLLKPMQAFERRVVHSELSKFSDIVTESSGEEPERRVLIKLKDTGNSN